uniref:Pregnancy-specific glycoprotein n=1 Tax=Mus musculus TaxID=10090 RepID=Q4JFC3_MOUSE|nr:pregnancy-specific glycoprotein [Mus musculus]
MEVSSELLSNGWTSWQRVLLTASLLTCWFLPITARVTIESVPPKLVEGENVLLRVDNLPENLRVFAWYRGVIKFKLGIALYSLDYNTSVTGPEHSGRETLHSNGSLWIQSATREDTGYYTFQTISKNGKVVSNTSMFLQVYSSLSSCCDAFNSVQLRIDPVPPHAVEGESVLLQVHNLPEDVQTFLWYKGVYSTQDFKIAEYSIVTESIISGRAHSGREIGYTNGSLLLQDVTEKDSGFYTLVTIDSNAKVETAHVQVDVNKLVTQPAMRVTDSTVRVQSSVVFTCFSDNTGVSIRWLFNNQRLQLTERMTLSPSKCQLRIHTVRKEDAGEYQCEAFNPVSSKTSLPVSLAVMNE